MEGTLSADPTELPPVQPTIALTGNEWAPFIYCDGVSALGTQAGAIQIELAARTILPTPDGGTRNEYVATAHLRCSPAAAIALKEALDKALAMLAQAMQQGQEQPPQPAPGRLN
jgi:hypothetical protein